MIFLILIGCASTQNKGTSLEDAFNRNTAVLEKLLISNDAQNHTLLQLVDKKTPANQPKIPSSPPAYHISSNQLTMEEITGKKEKTHATAKPKSNPAPNSSFEKRLSKVEKTLISHSRRINSLEYYQAKIDLAVYNQGLSSPSQLNGWEFGNYYKGSAVVTKEMLEAMQAVALELEKEVKKAASRKKIIELTLTFKSFTDKDGSADRNKQLRLSRSINCKNTFLLALKTVGITNVKTNEVDGAESNRGVTGQNDRYTEVTVVKTEKALVKAKTL
ncbi:hypothetical protein K8R32_05450 [bacterium]|nr:hypothetical protein [bacterium]